MIKHNETMIMLIIDHSLAVRFYDRNDQNSGKSVHRDWSVLEEKSDQPLYNKWGGQSGGLSATRRGLEMVTLSEI